MPLPRGGGPLVWMRLDGGAAPPLPGPVLPGMAGAVAAGLRRARPGVRLVASHPAAPGPAEGLLPDPGEDALACRALLAAADPAVLLVLGPRLPAALLAAAERMGMDAVVADCAVPAPAGGAALWPWPRRGPLTGVRRVFVEGAAARDAAIRAGAAPERVETTGAYPPPRPPLRAAETERQALAATLRGRQLWFAAGVPAAEEDAVLAAHRAALGLAHRALLILSPADPKAGEPLTRRLEGEGFGPALRSREDELAPDVQVLVADDPSEAGLWYRLAPFSYLGGTLSGAPSPDPWDAAALGSAILHGPALADPAAAAACAILDAAGAARRVAGAAELAAAVDALLAPDAVAQLAAAAWAVGTAGAAVAQRIARTVADILPADPPPR